MIRTRPTLLLLGLTLLAPAVSAAQSGFSLVEENGGLKVLDAGRPVLVYNHGMQLAPGNPEQYRRSTYVHPLWTPAGTMVTDDFPADHRHHRGLSWMWPAVRVDGKSYDLWHIRGIRQVFEEWTTREAGADGVRLGVRNSWRLADRKVLDEEIGFRIHPAQGSGRAIDVELTLRPLEPIQIVGQSEGNKGYGGLVLRFAPREDTRITTSEGRQTEDSDHSHVPWADESGRFGGASGFAGAAIFQHPDNPDYPAAWTLRHYGFVGNAWPGLKGATLEPGSPVTLRYRIWVHDGDATEGAVADAYRAYQSELRRSTSR